MKILILDGNALCHRVWHTTGSFSYQGKLTGIIYGFFLELHTLLDKHHPDVISCVWDSRLSNRRKIYPDYKKSRRDRVVTEEEKKYGDLCFAQFNTLREEILPSIGWTNNFLFDGFEGDDLISAIIRDNKSKDNTFVIATSDNDLYQELSESVIISDLGKKKNYTMEDFMTDHSNLHPNQWHQVKALAGCLGDGVKGIDRVGELTAIKYLNDELKTTTKTYKDIKSDEGQAVYQRNLPLVTLPFKDTPKIKLDMKQKLKFVELRLVFLDHGINSMVKKMDSWKTLLGLGR